MQYTPVSESKNCFLVEYPTIDRGTQWICSSKYLFFSQISAGWEILKKIIYPWKDSVAGKWRIQGVGDLISRMASCFVPFITNIYPLFSPPPSPHLRCEFRACISPNFQHYCFFFDFHVIVFTLSSRV